VKLAFKLKFSQGGRFESFSVFSSSFGVRTAVDRISGLAAVGNSPGIFSISRSPGGGPITVFVKGTLEFRVLHMYSIQGYSGARYWNWA